MTATWWQVRAVCTVLVQADTEEEATEAGVDKISEDLNGSSITSETTIHYETEQVTA